MANSTNAEGTLCCASHVSRTVEKGTGASHWEAAAERAEDGRELAGEPLASESSSERLMGAGSSREPIALPPGGCGVADEIERTRLITDISRLIQESAVPEGARLAGLTLIGWLARRRTDEAPHAIGIDEARESERRIRAARPKMR